ncbi:MAG: hypothetical protein ACRDQT_00495 [Gaiellaceae bacterium]
MPERPRATSAVAAGVLACVLVAVVLGALKLDEALGLFDFRADQNASLGYLERVYGDEGVVMSRSVVEEATAHMPADASYRVILGPNLRGEHRFTRLIIEDFLDHFLLPRRQVDSVAASWVLCYGCDVASLGARFQVLARSDEGIVFGRLAS